ncbi:MAG TPA: PIN domain-containing protein [Anaerolineae bacterium]|mgnify:CR=1 FL=1|nr:PIN domain-containing protein [Anaerolineae bacterium]HQI87167.1 PIN domain-containing protein [Anaerolineae bacterium]
MNTALLVDSGALLAMIDAGDKYHASAAAFVQSDRASKFHVPETVFIETMVLVKARLGAQAAVELGMRLTNSTWFVMLPWTRAERQATWQIFSRYTDKNWSYVDCSLLAAARRLRISEIFTFDQYFDQMPEVKRVPG